MSFIVMSYNMHGFNSGCDMIRDIISASDVDIFMLQEHWLTPANSLDLTIIILNIFALVRRQCTLV